MSKDMLGALDKRDQGSGGTKSSGNETNMLTMKSVPGVAWQRDSQRQIDS